MIANYFKCGKLGHRVVNCKGNVVTYYNCGEQCHISTNCKKLKKTRSGGKVFALSGIETTTEDKLIRGTCYINNIPLISIIDTGVTQSFIYLNCAKHLDLELTSMMRSMIVDTQALGPVILP